MVDAGGGNRILEILKEKQIKINKIHYLFVNHSHIEVPSMKAAKEFLEALGYSHRSYQEKRRGTYLLQRNELDIDT